MAIITLGDLKTIWESIRDRAYDSDDDRKKIKTVQKKFRDNFVGAAVDATKWDSTIGTGGSISVSGGTLILGSGTTASAETYVLSKDTFTIPCKVAFNLTLSQRIANQTFLVELVSVDKNTGVPDGLNQATLLWDGTTATQAKYRVQDAGLTAIDSAASTFPTSAGSGVYEIEATYDEVWFHGGTVDASTGRTNSYRRQQQIADPGAVYKLRIRWVNGATPPASGTNATLLFVTVQDFTELTAKITGGRGQTVSGQGLGVHIANTPAVTGSGTFTVGGVAAHDAAVSGSPVRIAGRALTANYTGVATGDTADLVTTVVGALISKPYAIPQADWQFACSAAITNTSDVVVKAAGAAGIKNYITGFQFINTNATATEIVLKDGTTVIWRGYAPANMIDTIAVQFATPLQGTAATAVNFACITTAANVYVNAQGYIAP